MPAEAPADVSVEAIGSKSMRIRWNPPMSMRYRNHIKGYYIGYKIASSDESFIYKTVEVNNQNGPYELMLTNLKRITKYIVIVKAFNRKGSGPPSNEFYVKTNDLGIHKISFLSVVLTVCLYTIGNANYRGTSFYSFPCTHRCSISTETRAPFDYTQIN